MYTTDRFKTDLWVLSLKLRGKNTAEIVTALNEKIMLMMAERDLIERENERLKALIEKEQQNNK
jgi:hypothetical protein